MDEFILDIDQEKFRSTNAKWNELMLNDPWSVGYVSTLIEAANWKNKEDWEQTYYASGYARNNFIKENVTTLGHSLDFFNDVTVPYNKSAYYALSWDIKNVNTQRGRTPEDFVAKGKILYDAVKGNGRNLTLDECIECVRFRVICETWNGIILRENNTMKTLQKMFPNLSFCKAEGEIDHSYAVDYQVYKEDKQIVALQVKPKTYLQNAPYILKARRSNELKYAAYKEKYGVPVLTIIATSKGEILNSNIIERLKTFI